MDSYRTRLQEGGRFVISADFRKALELVPGEEIIVSLQEQELRISPAKNAVKRAQQLMRKYTSKKNMVDELIAERRREAKLE